MTESLKDQVLRMLRDNRGKWPVIAEESGVGYWWILKFTANKIPNPGFDKIERLNRYFTGQPADRDRPTADARALTDAGSQTPTSTAGGDDPTDKAAA